MEQDERMHEELRVKEKKKQEGKLRARELAIAKQTESDIHTGVKESSSSTRHGAKNQHRHKHFAKWLLSTFPHVLDECVDRAPIKDTGTQNPMHILDVAGGKGELSARLCLCHSLHVTMVDPRQADIKSVYMNSVVPKLPNKWQASIDERIRDCPTFVDDLLERRYYQFVMPFDVPSLEAYQRGQPEESFDHQRNKFQSDMQPILDRAVRNASLIVGLHADSATEAIVDAALIYNKPFVVVPCCVFPNLFKNRFITVPVQVDVENADGGGGEQMRQIPVRTHEQFCEFLLKKDPRFKREILPFEGRNVAIWWAGK